jgi:dipicolinate synthase subunit B
MMELKQQRLRGVKIGVILTGSHCTINDVIPEIKHLIDEGADVLPVFSYTVDNS